MLCNLPQLSLLHHTKKTAPCEMVRGSATTDDQFAYFTPRGSYSVYRYEWSKEKWEKLPPCPYEDSGLVIIDGELTAVGGEHESYHTNQLFTLRQGQWVKHYPSMIKARESPAVVSTADGKYIFVIGGWAGINCWTDTVEVFQVRSKRWYELTKVPQVLSLPSATICGNQLYVVGHHADAGYTCLFESLMPTNEPKRLNIVWKSLPQQPVERSTAATLSGELVIVGGQPGSSGAHQGGRSPVNSILQLIDEQWVNIGSLSCGRSECLVVSPSPDKMMIVGGAGRHQRFDIAEECVVA